MELARGTLAPDAPASGPQRVVERVQGRGGMVGWNGDPVCVEAARGARFEAEGEGHVEAALPKLAPYRMGQVGFGVGVVLKRGRAARAEVQGEGQAPVHPCGVEGDGDALVEGKACKGTR